MLATPYQRLDRERIAGLKTFEQRTMAEVADELHVQVVDEHGGIHMGDDAVLHRAIEHLQRWHVDRLDEAAEVGLGCRRLEQLARLPSREESIV